MAMRIPTIEPDLSGTGNALAGPVREAPSNAGHGAAVLGHEIAGLAAEIQKQEDQGRALRVAQTENDFATAADQTLYDAQSGYMQARGQDAIDRTGDAYNSLRKLRAEHADKLAGDAKAAALFSVRSGQQMVTYQKAIEEHAGREKYALAGQVAENTFNRATIEAQRVYNDPAAVQQVWDNKLPIIMGYMHGVQGLPADVALEKAAQLRSAVFASAAERFVSEGQGSAGLRFLASKVGDETVQDILGPAADKTLAKLRPLAAQEGGDAIIRQLISDPRMQLGGRPNFERAFGVLNDAWAREQAGQPRKPGDPVFGSFDVFKASQQQLMSRQSEEHTSFETQRGSILTQAQAFAEQRGIRDFDVFVSRAPPMMKGALKDYAAETSLRRWFDAAKSEKPTNEQQVAYTRFLWNLANNENVYTGMGPDQFKSEIMDNLWPAHAEHARMLNFQILAQKGPVKEGYTQGRNLITQQLRNRDLIPRRSMGDVKYNDPTTWEPEQQDIYNTSMTIFGQQYQQKVTDLGGHAPPAEEVEKLTRFASRTGKEPGFFGERGVPLPTLLSRGQAPTGFEPPAAGTPEYRDFAAQVRAAREAEARALDAAGKPEQARLLRNKPITDADVARRSRDQAMKEYENFNRRFPSRAPGMSETSTEVAPWLTTPSP